MEPLNFLMDYPDFLACIAVIYLSLGVYGIYLKRQKKAIPGIAKMASAFATLAAAYVFVGW